MRTKIILISIVAVFIGAIIFAGCANKDEEKPETPVASRGAHNPAGENGVSMEGETQKRIGLATEMLTPTNFSRQVSGYGRVLDPAPLGVLAAELASTQIAVTTARQELERLKILQEHVSEKTLQLAQAKLSREQLAVEIAQTKLQSAWGEAIAAQENLAEFVRPLVAGKKILVRIVLPAGEMLSSNPTGITLMSLAGATPLAAQFFGFAPQMDEQMQGQGFLFLADGRSDFPPGAAVSGSMQISGEPERGVILPRPAILRHEGKNWVYLKTAGNHFVRREVHLQIPADSGWFVSNVATTSAVVTSGAQILLSEESKGQIGADE